MRYLAHRDQEDGREQPLTEHLNNTSALAGAFASSFGAEAEGKFCGRLHDIGKYSDAFQRRVRGAKNSVNHSTAGALEARRMRNVPAAFCIAGHHAGLPDLGGKADSLPESATLNGCFARKPGRDIEDYSAFKDEIGITPCDVPGEFIADVESAMFFTRMLYSCLVDADWLDTEAFMKNGAVRRGGFQPLETYEKALQKKLAVWLENPQGRLGTLRNEILRADAGLYRWLLPRKRLTNILRKTFSVMSDYYHIIVTQETVTPP